MIQSRVKRSINAWPGYVDALSALLMVVIFVLLIFSFGQFLLTQILTGQESRIGSLESRISELTELLGLEQAKSRELNTQVMNLSSLLGDFTEERNALNRQVQELRGKSAKDRVALEKQLLLIGSLQEDIDALRKLREELEQQVGGLSALVDARDREAGYLRDRSKTLLAKLADKEERTLLAQEKIDRQDYRIQALTVLIGQRQEALEEEKKLTANSRAELALLNKRVGDLKAALEEVARALDITKQEKKAQAGEIKDLGKRLNIELARRVNKLEQYRSEFFGRLNEILGDNPNVSIEGDRFLFQAELLFASGSATLEEGGRAQLAKLAVTLTELSTRIPGEINWLLRIDGHTDAIPIHTRRFASNWELSTARAVSVVRFLAEKGIPEKRLAATGFSKFHPLVPGYTEEAHRKNRRIEIKLTSR